MKPSTDFWTPNINRLGRILRCAAGVSFLLGGLALGVWLWPWLGTVVFLCGAFMVFEAARGWCLVRAMGMRTRY
jgi:hypothetical protein